MASTTAEQLLAAAGRGRCELIRGEVRRMNPAGYRHGEIVMRISGPLFAHVDAHGLGVVTGAETGFVLARDPDTVRAPDAAFVRAARARPERGAGFFEGAPDLAVEVLSPDDGPAYVRRKVRDWLDAGCAAVRVVDPASETVAVHESAGTLRLGRRDRLNGGAVLPGFTLRVAAIFGYTPMP